MNVLSKQLWSIICARPKIPSASEVLGAFGEARGRRSVIFVLAEVLAVCLRICRLVEYRAVRFFWSREVR